jgi:putative RecB family exonuclease
MNFDFDAEFQGNFDEAIAVLEGQAGVATGLWMSAGFRPRQDESWWRENGPAMAKAFADWYESQPEVNVWVTPDGRPAIELELNVMFGKHEVKMAIDQVLVAGTALVVNDLKSGSRRPVDPQQLGLYASGIQLAYGVRPKYGMYFMTRGIRNAQKEITGYVTEPIELDVPQYSIPFFTRMFDKMDKLDTEEVYLPHVTELCKMCGVNKACTAYGGPVAHLFDPDHPNYQGS